MDRKEFYLNIALASLAIHLFATNSRLLFHMNPDSMLSRNVFDFTKISIDSVLSMVFALSYSIMTVMVIKLIKLPFGKIWTFSLISYFAVIDGVGVYIYYNAFTNYVSVATLYYTVYTISIIMALGLHAVWGNDVKAQEVEEEEIGAINRKINARKAVLRRKKTRYDDDDELKTLYDLKDKYVQYVSNNDK